MSWRVDLDEAIAASEGLVDPVPLLEARRQLDATWRIVVIGRVSAGKTTWINRIAGDDGPTGLGGVTEAPREVDGGGRTYVDTPGIDDPDRAIVALQPLVDAADAAVWVVDGLQPLTASERDVAAVVLGDIQLSIVITKADLVDEAELDPVIARVRDLTASLRPVSLIAVNARQLSRLPPLHGTPGDLSARRRRMLADAEAAVRGALPEPPPDRAAALARWAEVVREQVQRIEHAIDRGAIREPAGATGALAAAADPARRALLDALGDLPVLPDPDVDPGRPAGSGHDAAKRALTAAAARWLAEGQLALREWWAEQPAPARALAAYERLVGALDAIRSHAAATPSPIP